MTEEAMWEGNGMYGEKWEDWAPKADPADICWMHLELLESCGCSFEVVDEPATRALTGTFIEML